MTKRQRLALRKSIYDGALLAVRRQLLVAGPGIVENVEFPPGGWVHVSYVRSVVVARKSSLLATIQDGRTVYTPWKGPVTT